MRSVAKRILFASSLIIILGAFSWFTGILSAPRDYSSPLTTMRLVDQNGASVSGVEISRHWYDSDCGKEGSETKTTDRAGSAQFSRIPAEVGLFTGSLRKAQMFFAICGSGSGTSTRISVRYKGSCEVILLRKQLHPEGRVQQDSDGVYFYTSLDSESNTLANLSFPSNVRTIDYTLSSRANTH